MVKFRTRFIEFLWQYTAAALAHTAEVTGMLNAAKTDVAVFAASRYQSLIAYCCWVYLAV